jgi:transcriptional regulator with XRE-family HTH domain
MQTIGERLEEARKRKSISIREAAEATKIRGDYLQKFENNQFDIGLSEIYVRGFLRTYAHFLKLSAERMMADYRELTAEKSELRPRTVSREVYGRMDLSVTKDGGAKGSRDEEPAPATSDSPSSTKGGPGSFTKIGSSLPTGTFIDQRIVMKVGMGLVAVIVVALIVWGISNLADDKSDRPAAKTQAAAVQAAAEPSATFYALEEVRIKVVLILGPEKFEEIWQGKMMRGETKVLPKRGPLFVTASEGKHLEVEVNGKRYPMPFTGYDRAKIP